MRTVWVIVKTNGGSGFQIAVADNTTDKEILINRMSHGDERQAKRIMSVQVTVNEPPLHG